MRKESKTKRAQYTCMQRFYVEDRHDRWSSIGQVVEAPQGAQRCPSTDIHPELTLTDPSIPRNFGKLVPGCINHDFSDGSELELGNFVTRKKMRTSAPGTAAELRSR